MCSQCHPGAFAFFGRPLWFATAYISLVALTPYLNRIFLLEDKALSRLVLVVGFVFATVATIPSYTAPEYLADFSWFVVMYVFVGWAKRTQAWERLPGKWMSLALGGGLMMALSLAQLHPLTAWVAGYWNVHLQCLPNILSAVLIFNFFRLSDFGVCKWINWLSRASFSVYIVHQVPAFLGYEWNVVFRSEKLMNLPAAWFAVALLAVPLSLFVVLAIVDRLYFRIAERAIERTAVFETIVRFLRRLYPSES